MALIKCPECGHEISEYADKCIFCGCPMEKIKEMLGWTKVRAIPEADASNFSNSELYKTLNHKEKTIVDEICGFVLNNTPLLKIDHSKNFGFRKKGHSKMVVMFKRSHGTICVYFRIQSKLLSATKFKAVSGNMNIIKESVLAVFSTKEKQKSSVKTKKSSKVTAPVEKSNSFTSSRKDYENYLINIFDQKIKLKIDDVFSRNYPYMYIFKIPKGEENITLCWFANGDGNKLAFKFYLRPLERESQKTLYPVSKDADMLVETVYKIYSSLGFATKRVLDNSEEPINEESPFETTPIKAPLIYSCIVKAIGDKTYDCEEDMREVCEEVKRFVLNEIMHKGIEQKYFKTEEEFNSNKYSYRFVPNFFGHTFSMRNITENDAKVFYSFYKAIKLIEVIKKYEDVYNHVIVHDYLSVLHELQEMIVDGGRVAYSSAKGLTPSFKFVPIDALDECLDKLNSFELLY